VKGIAMSELTLETERLVLRALRAADTGALLGIFADPRVMAAFGVAPFDREQMEGWVGGNLEHQAEHGYGAFSVILKSNGLLIGDCALELMEVDGGTIAELGYDFRSDCWNQGYATEAACAVRDYAFGALGLPKLMSLVRAGNLASARVAEKVGMRRAAEITRYGRPYWMYVLDAPGQPAAVGTAVGS
jgi:ribosomal-protein-alanine N-acetyltransferase